VVHRRIDVLVYEQFAYRRSFSGDRAVWGNSASGIRNLPFDDVTQLLERRPMKWDRFRFQKPEEVSGDAANSWTSGGAFPLRRLFEIES